MQLSITLAGTADPEGLDGHARKESPPKAKSPHSLNTTEKDGRRIAQDEVVEGNVVAAQLSIPTPGGAPSVGTKNNRFPNWRVLQLGLVTLLLAFCATRALADAALLMEEPYGEFGRYNPTGHSAIYLNRVCAESPVKLRVCRPDEHGVVISRYHQIDGFDWIAIPLVPYLYAVDEVKDVPMTADAELEARLRDGYRRRHLLQIAPNVSEKWGDIPDGN